jgi:hypothetical protein
MLEIAAGSQRMPSAPGTFCQSQAIRVFRNLKPARPKTAPKPHR